MATITKAHLVQNLLSKNIFTKGESTQVIDAIFELMKKSLEAGEDVLVSGFGKFSLREKCERNGRNPQTGERIRLSCRRVVTFRCSSVLREKVDKGGE